MNPLFLVSTMARRGMLGARGPHRVPTQLNALRRWGFSLAGELRQAAAREPDRVAVIDETQGEVSYRQLLLRAERLTRSLRGRIGISPGDRIGVMARNHVGLIEAVLAATMHGADTVLVNTGLSAAQLAQVAEEQQLRALIHDDEFTDRLVALPAEVTRIDENAQQELIGNAPPGELSPPDRPGRTASRPTRTERPSTRRSTTARRRSVFSGRW